VQVKLTDCGRDLSKSICLMGTARRRLVFSAVSSSDAAVHDAAATAYRSKPGRNDRRFYTLGQV
jgi:hypothetical protein